MEKEEEILDKYIKGTYSGEDNKLRAVVGSLTSKSSKELTEAIKTLNGAIKFYASNLILNNTSNIDRLNRGIDEQVGYLNRGIAQQTLNIINSNKELSESNKRSAEKTHKFTRINTILTFFIVLTGAISLWNIILTIDIKNESIRANQISEQPFLEFINDGGKPVKFINSGKGVALNILFLKWNNTNKELYVTLEGEVGGALGVGREGEMDVTRMGRVDTQEIVKKIPSISKIIQITNKENINWLALVYEDVYGRQFATLFRGTGGDYNKATEFLKLSDF